MHFLAVVLGLLLALAAVVLFLVVLVGVLVAGPARWVKISTFVLVLCFFGSFALLAGPSSLYLLGFSLVFPLLFMAVGALVHRLPQRLVLSEAFPSDCPPHAREKVPGWTEELSAAGFVHHCDRWQHWKSFGKEQRTFVRFLRHPGEPCWIELHALEKPGTVARAIVSRDAAGASIRTSDIQSDAEFFADPLSELHRHPRTTGCQRLLDLHREHTRVSGKSFQREDDPEAAGTELYDSWVDRLLHRGQLVEREEGWVGVPLAKIPGMIVRVLLAWFH